MRKNDERKQRVLELIAVGRLTIPQAAKKAGVAKETVRHWLRDDAEFRAQLEAWEAGPPVADAAVAQARRILFDEYTRRILYERTKLSLRDLMSLQDRLTRTANLNTETSYDDEDDDEEDDAITPEEADRIIAEVKRGGADPDGRAAGEPGAA